MQPGATCSLVQKGPRGSTWGRALVHRLARHGSGHAGSNCRPGARRPATCSCGHKSAVVCVCVPTHGCEWLSEQRVARTIVHAPRRRARRERRACRSRGRDVAADVMDGIGEMGAQRSMCVCGGLCTVLWSWRGQSSMLSHLLCTRCILGHAGRGRRDFFVRVCSVQPCDVRIARLTL